MRRHEGRENTDRVVSCTDEQQSGISCPCHDVGGRFMHVDAPDEAHASHFPDPAGCSRQRAQGFAQPSALRPNVFEKPRFCDTIENVSKIRGNFGAVQNRLEHRLANLATYQENLTASESRIRDVDMAAEMTKFTKLGILQQAGTSMLAQANQAPQSVLSLLR